MAKGTFVATVRAEDMDQGVNGEVRYALVPTPTNPQQDWLKFNIDPISGNITTAEVLDRETQELYYVSITVQSLLVYPVVIQISGGPALAAEVTVTRQCILFVLNVKLIA